MKKENKLFLSIFIGFLIVIIVVAIINNSIKKGIDLENLKGELFSLIGEDDGGWGEFENEESEEGYLEELENISNEDIENVSLNENLKNIFENQDIDNNLDERLNETKKESYSKQGYEDISFRKRTESSEGGVIYEFTIGFYISIILIILALGAVSFWFYSFFKKKN